MAQLSVPSENCTASFLRKPPATSTLMDWAICVSCRGIRISTSSIRNRRYGVRFLPRVLVSTDTSATLPQPTALMKSTAITPPFFASRAFAGSERSIFMGDSSEAVDGRADLHRLQPDGPERIFRRCPQVLASARRAASRPDLMHDGTPMPSSAAPAGKIFSP